jgi:lambda family phage portal protein
MNWLDSVIASVNPERAVKRAQARQALKIYSAYEAAKPSTLRKQSRDSGSGNRWVSQAGPNLRNQARYLDANHDLAKGVLNALVNNVVGANGIGIEPQPRTFGGEIHADFANQLMGLYKDWCKYPEVSHRFTWSQVQRLMCRSWVRDGEAFSKDIIGLVPFYDHATKVMFSVELLEADMLPLIYDDPGKDIHQGIQVNGWGQPKNYYFYRQHPGELNNYSSLTLDLKPVSADLVNHLALIERLSQLRGVSIFASVMTRLDDIKDYEESERIAAKIAACMAAYIKKGQPDMYIGQSDLDGGVTQSKRDIKFSPGMVFDDLGIGEDIGTIDTNRPNSNLVGHRMGQMRAVASGTGVNYSTIARDYDGSYSSQRQELVEGWNNYQVLTNEFISSFSQPCWETFVQMAIAGNLVKVPADVDPMTADDALFIGPSMPWIDPLKEIKGQVEAERAGYISGQEIIRRRGGNPHETLEQESRWRKLLQDKGLISTADPKNDNAQNANADIQPAEPAQVAQHRRR